MTRDARIRDDDRTEEMRAHLELHVEQLMAQGRSREAAEREARIRFGNPRVKLEEIGDMTRWAVLDSLARDMRYALRVMRRSPLFTATVIATLALVIGANTAVFSLADAILYRPPPFPEPDRLAFVTADVRSPRGESRQLSHDAATWEAVRDFVPSLDAAVYFGGIDDVNLVVDTRASFVEQQRVGAGYFRVMGVAPAIGRGFLPEEDVPGGPALAVLSHRLWLREFGGDPAILGRSIRLRGEPYEVVGVMPASFDEASEANVWTPLRPSRQGEGAGTNFMLAARLVSGATWDQARAELRNLGAEPLRVRGVREEDGVTGVLGARPIQDVLVEGNREPIVMLGAGTLAVLLIACVNIAALLLGRGGTRAKELATRMALGCGRRAVIRQLMVENVMLGLAGGLLGVLVASVGLAGLQYLGESTFQVWEDAALNGRVLAVTAGLALLTSTLFGLVPAVQASRLDPQHALVEGGSRSVAGGSRTWPGRTLVVTEVALGVALLIVTGLLVRTFVNLRGLDPGFDPDGLVTASVSLQDARYQADGSVNRLITESLRELRARPDVESAAVSLQVPYTRLLNWGFRFTDATTEGGSLANVAYVSDGFFETYRIDVRSGRTIAQTDGPDTLPVVVVNETFVRAFGADRPMVGRRLALSGAEREVVGVVGDVQQTDSGFAFEGRVPGPLLTTPTIYLPVSQTPASMLAGVHTWFRPAWTVRPRARGQAAGAIAEAIGRVDALLPVTAEQTVARTIARATAVERLMMMLVGVLAAVALLLATLGIHGLIAQSVGQRTRELAIRLALGASPGGTVGRVAASGVVLASVGALAGGVMAVWATRLVQSFLWGVDVHDVATYAGIAAFFVVVAALASLVPALRILRLDPAETLRN